MCLFTYFYHGSTPTSDIPKGDIFSGTETKNPCQGRLGIVTDNH